MEISIFEIALLMLLAIMTGVSIPLIVELRSAARGLREQVGATGADAQQLIGEVRRVAGQVEKLMHGFDDGERRIAKLMSSVEHASEALDQASRLVRIGTAAAAAIGPAAVAFVQTMRSDGPPPEIERRERGNGSPHAYEEDDRYGERTTAVGPIS